MAHEAQDRYSSLVKAKLRNELVLKDGIVFNNDYEGDPTAGNVKIPVRDTEVQVSDYDKANGLSPTNGSTVYEDMPINKDKAINEIIDGFDAEAVPDNLVADRLDSGSESLATQIDTDGGTCLLGAATVTDESELTVDNVYNKVVDLRVKMSKAKIPLKDGKRYLLATPDTMGLLIKSPQFSDASTLSEEVKKNGAVGKIAGFTVYEWNDDTANLAMIGGHPKFATRAAEFSVPVHLQDLAGSGKYIGASAVQGRYVYGHKVLRSAAINAVYAPGYITVSAAASDAGKTILTVTGGTGTLKYTKNPTSRVTYDNAYSGGTALTSGTTKIAVSAGDVIEVVNMTDSKVKKVGYITIEAANIGAV